MPTTTYKKIASYELASNSSTSYEFTNIPQTYKHLMIHIKNRNADNPTEQWGFTVIGASTGMTSTNLYNQYTRYTGGLSSDTQTFMNMFYVTGAGATAGFFGQLTLFIPDYTSSSKYKTIYFDSIGGDTAQVAGNYQGYGTGQIDQNIAITNLKFDFSYKGWSAGNYITLYGLTDQ